jgi:hypothetical protein
MMRVRDRANVLTLSLVMLSVLLGMRDAKGASAIVSPTLAKTKICAGEPVLLMIHVSNTTTEPLEFDLGTNGKENVLITVTDPNGTAREKPGEAQRQGMTFFSWMRLQPKQDYFETLVLNEWFKFDAVGSYKIDVRFKRPATVSGQKLTLEPFSLALEVVPHDAAQLTSTCRNLINQLEHPQADKGSLAVSQALKSIHDPSLVPFWGEVLRDNIHSEVREISAANLASIGNREAVHELSRAIESGNGETKKLAHAALKQIATVTSDPAIKMEAEKAESQR